jgi:hypothetical protein
MKPENKFRKWFLDNFRTYMLAHYPTVKITVQKHADYATDGIADIDVSINGMTMWLEVKLLTSCQEERKLHVTPLQRGYLETRAKGGVPTGLLVGLALGPRKGYRVAVFIPPISEVVHRDMFRPMESVAERLYAMARQAAHTAHTAFLRAESDRTGGIDFAGLDVCDDRPRTTDDDADEDGG